MIGTEKGWFSLSKSVPIIIYGYCKAGIEVYHRLSAAGYHISCFIDRKAPEFHNSCIIEGANIPICQLEECSFEESEPIVYIAVRNSVEQTNVAKTLWKHQFQKAIFFPMIEKNMKNHKSIESLRDFYIHFTTGKVEVNFPLPTLESLFGEDIFWDHALIRREDEQVLAWVPMALLHFYTEEKGKSFTKKEKFVYEYWNKNVFRLKWLNELFRFLIKGEGNLDYYEFIEGSAAAENNLRKFSSTQNQLWLTDRQKCVDFLMSGMNTEDGFLIQVAIPVQWNDGGYFNICDGSHRLAFLNSVDMQMVAVRLSLEDYKKWINYEALQNVLAFIRENEITSFETPIPHPWFYGCETREEKFGRTILKCVLEQLEELHLKNDFSVLDTNPREGYYLQYFARTEEAGKIVGIVRDEMQFELITQLNQLFYLDKRIQLVGIDSEACDGWKYDIVLMLKILCTLEGQEKLQYLKWIVSKAEKMIIWESGSDWESERNFIIQQSEFKKYTCLKRTLSDGTIREVGIFMREEAK